MRDHVVAFENWFIQYQKDHKMEGSKLDNIEHAILRAYIHWLRNHVDPPG